MQVARSRLRSVLVAVLAAVLPTQVLSMADEIHPVLDRDVLPLLKVRCLKCHSPLVSKGKLNLSSPRSLARGGSSGAVIVPGNLEESVLWDLVSSDEMPPKPEEPLSADEKGMLRRWIEQGRTTYPARPRSAALHLQWTTGRLHRRQARGLAHLAMIVAYARRSMDSSKTPSRTKGSPRSRCRSHHLDPPTQFRPDGLAAAG